MRRGATLTEVIAGAIILSIAFGGLLATFISVRKYVQRANKRLIVTDLLSQTLNDLYRAVRADTWDSGVLRLGSINLSSYTIDGLVYQDGAAPNNYSVTATGDDFRRVNVTINYP